MSVATIKCSCTALIRRFCLNNLFMTLPMFTIVE